MIRNADLAYEMRLAHQANSQFDTPADADADVAVLEPGYGMWRSPELKPTGSQRTTRILKSLPRNAVACRQNRIDRELQYCRNRIAELTADPEPHMPINDICGTGRRSTPLTQRDVDRKVAELEARIDTLMQAPVNAESVVYRIMTYDHIPAGRPEGRQPQRETDVHQPVALAGFQHFRISGTGSSRRIITVGKSSIDDAGRFRTQPAPVTTWLYAMYARIAWGIAQKPNWRGYSDIVDMQGDALLRLIEKGTKFNFAFTPTKRTPEGPADGWKRQPNPFSYMNAIVENSYRRHINDGKTAQQAEDDWVADWNDDRAPDDPLNCLINATEHYELQEI